MSDNPFIIHEDDYDSAPLLTDEDIERYLENISGRKKVAAKKDKDDGTSTPGVAGFNTKRVGKKLNHESVLQVVVKGYIFGDALICLYKALKAMNLNFKETITLGRAMMGGKPDEIPFVHHVTDKGDVIPYGSYLVEGIGKISPVMAGGHAVPEMGLTITFEQRGNVDLWNKLLAVVYEELKTHVSLFKGMAIKVKQDMDLVLPNYIDVTQDLFMGFNDEVVDELENNLWFAIDHPKECEALGMDGKRGILLHGKYGTGKSLVAYETARRSVANGRTFILCNSTTFTAGVAISRLMEPATLFVEDMDNLHMSYGALSQLRNALSGVEDKKGIDVKTILTTNFLDKVVELDRSLLRPDRIDAIIEIPIPSPITVFKILKYHLGIDYDLPWEAACLKISDMAATPAIIVDAVKRAKVRHLRSREPITADSLMAQFPGLMRQLELSEPSPPQAQSVAETLAESLKEVVRD